MATSNMLPELRDYGVYKLNYREKTSTWETNQRLIGVVEKKKPFASMSTPSGFCRIDFLGLSIIEWSVIGVYGA